MNFNNPSFLYGLFALSIPVIVHLFNFRKAKTIYFSNTRFLQLVKETSSAKRRLKHYLVLLSRLFFVFFFVMAFAQPFLPANENGLSSKMVSIYMDTSQSMENITQASQRAFDQALEYVREIVNLYPKSTKFRLLTNDFDSFSNSYKSVERIEDYCTELSISAINRTFTEVENRRMSVANALGTFSEDVYIISDFQKSTIGSTDHWNTDSSSTYHLIPIHAENTHNVAIDSLYIEAPFILDRSNVSLIVKIRNYGIAPIANVNLKVFVEQVQVSSTSISLLPQETKTFSFDVSFELKEQNKARVLIDDYPVTFDDEFFFIINTSNKIEVLEIVEEENITIIGKVYGNKEVFNTVTQSIANIDYNRIISSDLVVINQLTDISSALATALKNYVRKGGRVLIVPSEKSSIAQFEQIIPEIKWEHNENTAMHEMTKPDLNHPFYETIFEEKQIAFSMPHGQPVFKWNGTFATLLQYKSGIPFLAYSENTGKVFFMNTPLDDRFTDFHKHAIFVPIMYKIATYQSAKSPRSYFSLNESTLDAKLDSLEPDQIYKIRQEDIEVIPKQRLVGSQLVMELPSQSLKQGFASVHYDQAEKFWLAFNSDKRESNLEPVSTEAIEQFAAQRNNVTVFSSSEAKTFSKEIKERYLGKPLWRHAVVLALLFLFIEILIIRYMR